MALGSIGINILFLIPNEVGGTEYYTRSFLEELEKQDLTNNYVVFCNRENAATFNFSNPRWQKIICPVSAKNRLARVLFEQFRLPALLHKSHCTIVHSFGYTSPLFSRVKQIVTVHDANWLDHPIDVSFLQRIPLRLLNNWSIKKATCVLTDSSFARSRLLHFFPKHAQKIIVLEPAVDSRIVELLQKQLPPSVQGPYLLCVSAMYPHKKIPYLLEMWSRIQAKNENLSLVLVGQHGSDEKNVSSKVSTLKQVIWKKKVSMQELCSLYQHAQAFIFPSVYEGFGYPVYEALVAGVPVWVARSELYNPKIKASLHILNGDPEKDSTSIVESSQHGKNQSVLHTYSDQTRKLIQLYQALVT